MSSTILLAPGRQARPSLATRLREGLHTLLQAEWSRIPPWFAVALGTGILLYFALPTEPSEAWLWLPWPLLAPALWLRRRAPLPGLLLGLAGTVALGFALAVWARASLPPVPDLPRRAVILTGTVDSVERLPGGRRVVLTGARPGEGQPALERSLRLRLKKGDETPVSPGDRLRVRALLRPPPPPPAPGAWDYQRAAFFEGRAGSASALAAVERLEAAPPSPGGSGFAGLRSLLEQRVLAVLGSGATGTVSSAMLTGSQTPIPDEAVAAMRDSGLAHLLSVAGLHVAIVIGLGMSVVRLLVALVPPLALRVDSKSVAAATGLLLGAGYTVLTGSQVPMLRSLAMAALATLAMLLGRRVVSLRALALAAALVLAWQPAALLGPSFQMSFAAVLALIAGWEAMRAPLDRLRGQGEAWRRGLVAVLGLTLTSLLAGLATMPYGLHHFGRLQLYGVVANAVAVPVTSLLVMPAGMLAVLLMPFRLEWLALVPMGWGTEIVLATARRVASWPGAAAIASPIPAWGLLLASFGMLWLCLWRTRWRWAGVPLILLGLFSGPTVPQPDLLVSADARLIAYRSPEGVFLERGSGSNGFARDSWLRDWGEAGFAPLPAEEERMEAGLRCAADHCLLRPRPGAPAIALLRKVKTRRGAAAAPIRMEPWCDSVAVLVSAEPVRGRCRTGRAPLVVDRFSVWRDGAQAVFLGPEGARVVTDRMLRGERPWVPPVPKPRPREAPAQEDEGGTDMAADPAEAPGSPPGTGQ
ncbi:ComEC/Rec2 family competence protein [Roseomonas mucosa]|uniref:ComEC/Rec2 family competence protein n=1 Tax=Roseomonas mucosa TaxID=207340 RepID=UPI002B417CDC|nr:ComEC/Rec2 family competence protein [Roseomonas mucosa]QDE00313.1 DNA translocation competence protein ComA [Roseomonas mucosa]